MTSLDSSAGSDPRAYRLRVIVATSIGNALEWFDFVAYGFLAVTMARLFFPGSSDVAALLLTFGTFGVPFLVRPLGAIVMGAYADRRGRKAALLLSIGLMMLGTLTMAVVPTFNSIGIAAAAIVIVARVLQGFSVGGEFGPALAFLVEQDPNRRGALASWHYASQSITTVLATGFGAGLNFLLTPAELEAWGWRIPFVFGLLVGPAGYYIRARLRETPAFEALQITETPVRRVVADHGLSIVRCVGAIVVSSITVYTVLFMPTFAVKQLGLSPSVAFLGGLLAGTIQVFLIPVVGLWSDRAGRTLIPLVSAAAILLLIYPMFTWLVAVPQLTTLLMVQGILAVLNSLNLGCLGGLISELFPTRVLASGLSISNAVAQTVFGGFTPFLGVWLINITGNQLAPSFYLMFGAAVSIAALVALRRAGFR
jgi:MFS transporter, MHS family, proline/betaine transporter